MEPIYSLGLPLDKEQKGTGMNTFWKEIETQLDRLTTAKTAADVMSICPPTREGSKGSTGFFAGGGGDTFPAKT